MSEHAARLWRKKGAAKTAKAAEAQNAAGRLTALLIRVFAGEGDPREPVFRGRCGVLAGAAGTLVNLLLFGVKFAVGRRSGSVAVTADAMNNLLDAAASLLSLAAFRLAAAPPDEKYPCGRGRAEYLTGLGMAALILIVGGSLLKSSCLRVLCPAEVCFSLPLLAALFLTIPMKFLLAAFDRRLGRYIGSTALLAMAADCRADALATCAVLTSGLVTRFTGVQPDAWAGLAVAIFIIAGGLVVGKNALPPLLGAGDKRLAAAVKAAAAAYAPFLTVRGEPLLHSYGPARCYGTLRVKTAPGLNEAEREALLDGAEQAVYQSCGVTLTLTER